MKRLSLFFIFTLTWCTYVAGLEIQFTEIQWDKGVFSYRYSVNLNASKNQILKVLTSFEGYTALNKNILKSEVVRKYEENHIKRRITIKKCIIKFCFNLQLTEAVIVSKATIKSEIIANHSTFYEGNSFWEIRPLSPNKSIVNMTGSLKPKFWIPPIIGPFLMERIFIKEVSEIMKNVEALAKI